MAAGYSTTPLAKKLGIKEGFIIKLINAPDYYFDLFTDFPENVILDSKTEIKKNLIHFFAMDAEELHSKIIDLKLEIEENGMIWISWPKKSAKVLTDITEDVIRDLALKNGLVDVKVCAVDEVWSALKLVIPLKYRRS